MARKNIKRAPTKQEIMALAKAASQREMAQRLAFINKGVGKGRPAQKVKPAYFKGHFKPGTIVKTSRWKGGASIVPVGKRVKGGASVRTRPAARAPIKRRR